MDFTATKFFTCTVPKPTQWPSFCQVALCKRLDSMMNPSNKWSHFILPFLSRLFLRLQLLWPFLTCYGLHDKLRVETAEVQGDLKWIKTSLYMSNFSKPIFKGTTTVSWIALGMFNTCSSCHIGSRVWFTPGPLHISVDGSNGSKRYLYEKVQTEGSWLHVTIQLSFWVVHVWKCLTPSELSYIF